MDSISKIWISTILGITATKTKTIQDLANSTQTALDDTKSIWTQVANSSICNKPAQDQLANATSKIDALVLELSKGRIRFLNTGITKPDAVTSATTSVASSIKPAASSTNAVSLIVTDSNPSNPPTSSSTQTNPPANNPPANTPSDTTTKQPVTPQQPISTNPQTLQTPANTPAVIPTKSDVNIATTTIQPQPIINNVSTASATKFTCPCKAAPDITQIDTVAYEILAKGGFLPNLPKSVIAEASIPTIVSSNGVATTNVTTYASLVAAAKALVIVCDDTNCLSCPEKTSVCVRCKLKFEVQSDKCKPIVCLDMNCTECRSSSSLCD